MVTRMMSNDQSWVKLVYPKEDIDRAIEAETVIWKEKIRPVLASRKAQLVKSREQNYIDLSKLDNTQKKGLDYRAIKSQA